MCCTHDSMLCGHVGIAGGSSSLRRSKHCKRYVVDLRLHLCHVIDFNLVYDRRRPHTSHCNKKLSLGSC